VTLNKVIAQALWSWSV